MFMSKKEMAKNTAILLIAGALLVLAWYIKRELNYGLMYKSKMEKTIEEAVAPLEKRLKELEEIVKKGKGFVSPTI